MPFFFLRLQTCMRVALARAPFTTEQFITDLSAGRTRSINKLPSLPRLQIYLLRKGHPRLASEYPLRFLYDTWTRIPVLQFSSYIPWNWMTWDNVGRMLQRQWAQSTGLSTGRLTSKFMTDFHVKSDYRYFSFLLSRFVEVAFFNVCNTMDHTLHVPSLQVWNWSFQTSAHKKKSYRKLNKNRNIFKGIFQKAIFF